MKSRARSRAQWIELVKDLGESGDRTQEFAVRHGVNARTLAWWRSQLRRGTGTVAPRVSATHSDVRLLHVMPTRSDASTLHDETPEVTIALGSARVLVRRGVDAATLATVIEVVARQVAR